MRVDSGLSCTETLTFCPFLTHLLSNLMHFKYLDSDDNRELLGGVKNEKFPRGGPPDLHHRECIPMTFLVELHSIATS